jgi:import receptor subunit TOM22
MSSLAIKGSSSSGTSSSTASALITQAQYVAKRLSLSVGKAAWLASTTLLVLLVPLVIEMDREQQLIDMEKEQMSVLTSPKSS